MNMTWTISDDKERVTIVLDSDPPKTVTFERRQAPQMLWFLQRAAMAWMAGR